MVILKKTKFFQGIGNSEKAELFHLNPLWLWGYNVFEKLFNKTINEYIERTKKTTRL
jgi:hypothetical protein